jgi:hypothetical protein
MNMHVFSVLEEPSKKYELFLDVVAIERPTFKLPVIRGSARATVFASNVRNITVERVSTHTSKTWLNFTTNLTELDNAHSALLDEAEMPQAALLALCVKLPLADARDELTPTSIHVAEITDDFLASVDAKLNMNSGCATILRAAKAKWARPYKLVLMAEEK